MPRPSGADEVGDVERRLAEELSGALLLQYQQPALNDAQRGRRDVPAAQLLRALADLVEHGAQVVEVDETHCRIAGGSLILHPTKRNIEDPLLGLGELQQPGEQQGPHALGSCSHRVALLAQRKAQAGCAARPISLARSARPGLPSPAAAIDVGGEDGDAGGREPLGEDLEGDGFARAVTSRWRLAGASSIASGTGAPPCRLQPTRMAPPAT
jgi:hypothetical protein